MNCTEVQARLNDYVDGDLPADERQEVEKHLSTCSDCREELNALRSLLMEASSLPKSISPRHDLWSRIEEQIERQGTARGKSRSFTGVDILFDFGQRILWAKRLAPVALALLVAVGAFWYVTQQSGPGWSVTRIEGTPKIGSSPLDQSGQIRVGQWLETDNASRAKIDVGMIGLVEVQPNTRIRLVEAKLTNHRLALHHGTIHARIWAPPRLFFVETPSALAVDLGCEYVLHVDEAGAGILQVTSGWVALEYGGRESIIPAGAMCATRPGIGPGTPFLEDASGLLRAALLKYDFEHGGEDALSTILDEARNVDSITLWHLFFRSSAADRPRVYDRMASLVPPPVGVSREGMLQGNAEMVKAWQKHLNLGMKPWWKFWQ